MGFEQKGFPKRNDTVDELIRKFVEFDEKNPFISIDAREELQERFSGQSHQDQIKIIRTFLESVDDVDHEWCRETMQTWWDDCLIPDVKKVWETYGESCCAGIVAKRLPLDFVMEHQEALENGNYAAVCWRLATTEDFDIYENEMTRKEFLDIAAHNHWSISDADADELMFGFILDILDDQCVDSLRSQGYGHGVVHDGVKVYMEPKRFLEPSSYSEPSLLHIVDMSIYVDALEKLGKVNTLKKLYDWNERLKDTLADHITNPDNHGEIVGVLSEGYATYMKYIWRCFMEMASHTFPSGKHTFRKMHNKYSFAKQEQREYYPGYVWEEETI